LLDQAYAYDPDVITIEDIDQICGAVSFQKQIEIVQAIKNVDSATAIQAMDELISSGKEVTKICQNLIQFFRDILVYKNVGKTESTSSLYQAEEFIKLTQTMNNRRLFFYLDILNRAQNDIKWSNSPRLYLELAFIKMTDDEPASDAHLLQAIDRLETRLAQLEKPAVGSVASVLSPLPVQSTPTDPVPQPEPIKQPIAEPKKAPIPAPKEEPVIASEPVLAPTVTDVVKTSCIDLSKTYSIEFIEEVLNRGNRDDKNELIDRWNLIRTANPAGVLAQYAGILGSGTLVASSGDKIIITFASAGVCNRLMKPAVKKIGQDILKNAFKREIDYMALPGEIFQAISDEFVASWRLGKRKIKLSPIVCADLRDVSDETEEKAPQSEQKVIADAMSLFGDLVKVKK